MVDVVATLSLATDLSLGVPLEHGLHSALVARRLSDMAQVNSEQAARLSTRPCFSTSDAPVLP